jgi:hypothetical protein
MCCKGIEGSVALSSLQRFGSFQMNQASPSTLESMQSRGVCHADMRVA